MFISTQVFRNLIIKVSLSVQGQVVDKTQKLFLGVTTVLSLLLIFRNVRVRSGKRECQRKKRVQREKGMSRREQMVKGKLSYSLTWWSGVKSNDSLKRTHGKRMALKVNKDDSPAVLLQKTIEKWKAYFSNCYDNNEDCILLLEDYKDAMFLPGSNMEFFTLERYREELGKDYKHITLFLRTLTDFRMSEGGTPADGKQPEDKLWDEAIDLPIHFAKFKTMITIHQTIRMGIKVIST